jgi:type IV pilus assembly protein PilN
MRISVNLATRPFIELRPLYARLRLAVVALAVVVGLLGFVLHSLSAKASVAEAKMNALKAKTAEFQQVRQRNETRMRQPQNMAVLERSQFLNGLFARKSFSWTAVMMDLEHVLPAGVQVTSIDPATSKTGDVNIRLRVSGERDRAVELMRNLEKSQRFVAPRLAGEAAQAQEGRGAGTPMLSASAVEFEIYSGYNPLPDVSEKGTKVVPRNTSDQDKVKSPSSKSSRAARGKGTSLPAHPMTGGKR